MFVDILSDTHFDSWFGYPYKGESDPKSFPPNEKVVAFWQRLRPKGEYLIIAGDIGHSLTQNLHILTILKKEFYKELNSTNDNKFINPFGRGNSSKKIINKMIKIN